MMYTAELLPNKFVDTELLDMITDRDEVERGLRQSSETAGRLLEGVLETALLVDPLLDDCPIVGTTDAMRELTLFSRDEMLGRNCRMLLDGVPSVDISRSSRKSLRDYCRMCRLRGLSNIAEVTAVQQNTRADGSRFLKCFTIGLCWIGSRRYILGVVKVLEEATGRAHIEETKRGSVTIIQRLRALFSSASELPQSPPRCSDGPGFGFFAERLQDHCVLLNGFRTVVRREPLEIASNCMVFGDAPVARGEHGLFFEVRVDAIVSNFEGLPMLGYTRKKPVNSADLYPRLSKCLGQSVLVGSCGEAFARDKDDHFVMGFKPPSQEEVAHWTSQSDLPRSSQKGPVHLRPGDRLGCMYTNDGRIQLFCNGFKTLDFDTQRPVQASDYYVVVDVCFTPYSLTLL